MSKRRSRQSLLRPQTRRHHQQQQPQRLKEGQKQQQRPPLQVCTTLTLSVTFLFFLFFFTYPSHTPTTFPSTSLSAGPARAGHDECPH